ncbi:MAG: flippase-like domain-containing protein [Acidobacteria bacterium]|nr:flippase-like domain-containing protein [Acidobacteriota bacterium]
MSGSRRGRLLAAGLLALLLLGLFFRGVDWHELVRALRTAHPGWLAAVVLSTILVYAARAWRWGYLLAPLARVPFPRLFSATVVGFMTGLVVPRAGEVVRPYLVARRHALQASAAFASIIIERLVDLITVLVLFSLYLYVLPTPGVQKEGALTTELKRAGVLVALAAIAVLAVLVTFHVHAERALSVVDRILRRLPERLAAPVNHALRSFGEGLAVLQAPGRHLAGIFAQSVLVWLLIALGIWANNRAFGLDLPFHTTFLMLGFLTVGVAVPTPGMVGGFHVAYQLALTKPYGVDRDVAAAAGIACHALTNLPVLVLGLWFLGREGLTMGRVAEMADDAAHRGKDHDDSHTGRHEHSASIPALGDTSGGADR